MFLDDLRRHIAVGDCSVTYVTEQDMVVYRQWFCRPNRTELWYDFELAAEPGTEAEAVYLREEEVGCVYRKYYQVHVDRNVGVVLYFPEGKPVAYLVRD